MITKKEELEIINQTIAKLGPNSYLGPWLSSVRFELEAAIRSDLVPEVSLKQTSEQCARMVESAKRESQNITNRAKYKADEIMDAAQTATEKARTRIMDAQKELVRVAMSTL
jgi:hypothetical protein